MNPLVWIELTSHDLNRGKQYYQKRDYSRAIEYFSEVISFSQYKDILMVYKNIRQAYLGRGKVYRAKKLWQLAYEDFVNAIHLNPHDPIAYTETAYLYYQQRKLDSAIDYFNDAISLDPEFTRALHGLGMCYLKKGDWELALKNFTQGIKYQPQEGLAYSSRAVIYLHKKQFDAALEDLDTAIKQCSLSTYPHHIEQRRRAVAFILKKDFLKAHEELNQLIQKNPRYVSGFLLRGIAYLHQGDHAKASQDFQTAKQLTTNLIIYTKIALYHYKITRDIKELKKLAKTLALQPLKSAEEICLKSLLAFYCDEKDQVKKIVRNFFKRYLPGALSPFWQEDFIAMLLTVSGDQDLQEEFQKNKCIVQLKDQMMTIINGVENQAIKYNALLQALCQATVLGNIFYTQRNYLHRPSLQRGRLKEVATLLEYALSSETTSAIALSPKTKQAIILQMRENPNFYKNVTLQFPFIAEWVAPVVKTMHDFTPVLGRGFFGRPHSIANEMTKLSVLYPSIQTQADEEEGNIYISNLQL